MLSDDCLPCLEQCKFCVQNGRKGVDRRGRLSGRNVSIFGFGYALGYAFGYAFCVRKKRNVSVGYALGYAF